MQVMGRIGFMGLDSVGCAQIAVGLNSLLFALTSATEWWCGRAACLPAGQCWS